MYQCLYLKCCTAFGYCPAVKQPAPFWANCAEEVFGFQRMALFFFRSPDGASTLVRRNYLGYNSTNLVQSKSIDSKERPQKILHCRGNAVDNDEVIWAMCLSHCPHSHDLLRRIALASDRNGVSMKFLVLQTKLDACGGRGSVLATKASPLLGGL